MPRQRRQVRHPHRSPAYPPRLAPRWGWVALTVLAVVAGALVWRTLPVGDRPQQPPSSDSPGVPVTQADALPGSDRQAGVQSVAAEVYFTQYDAQTGAIRLVARQRQLVLPASTASPSIPAERSEQALRSALEALLAGPTPSEQQEGLGTEIPPDTRLRQLRIKGGTAFVDLTGGFEQGGGSTSVQARLGQVVYTATQFPELARQVQFYIDGQAREWLSGEGILIDHPFSRQGIPNSF